MKTSLYTFTPSVYDVFRFIKLSTISSFFKHYQLLTDAHKHPHCSYSGPLYILCGPSQALSLNKVCKWNFLFTADFI